MTQCDQLAYQCCRDGKSSEDLAEVFDVSSQTIRNWSRAYPSFARAIQAGRDHFDTHGVEKSLLRKAMGYEYTEVRTEEITLKQGRGENQISAPAIKRIVTNKHVVPSDTAAMFWLQNRNKKRWKPIHAILMELQKSMGNEPVDSSGRIDLEKLVKGMGRDGLKQLREALIKETAADDNEVSNARRSADGVKLRKLA